jgi:hypothetical protein
MPFRDDENYCINNDNKADKNSLLAVSVIRFWTTCHSGLYNYNP